MRRGTACGGCVLLICRAQDAPSEGLECACMAQVRHGVDALVAEKSCMSASFVSTAIDTWALVCMQCIANLAALQPILDTLVADSAVLIRHSAGGRRGAHAAATAGGWPEAGRTGRCARSSTCERMPTINICMRNPWACQHLVLLLIAAPERARLPNGKPTKPHPTPQALRASHAAHARLGAALGTRVGR